MESQKPKIALYAKRSFGDKLNASFEFIKENWKPLLKYSTYLILPVCLIQALSLNGLMGGALDLSELMKPNSAEMTGFGAMAGQFYTDYAAYSLLSMIGFALLSSVVYGLIRTYSEKEERLQGITLSAFKPLLLRNIKRLLLLMLLSVLLFIVVVLLLSFFVIISPFTLILIIPLLIACSVPLALLAPIYLFEDCSVMTALKKTFRLGFATWGGIFVLSFVMGLIGGVLQGVTMVPWYMATLVKYFFSISDTGDATTVSTGYSFLLYLLAIVHTYGAYLSMIFTFVGLAYQYGHASEVVDSITVESDIDKFDKI